MWFGILIIFLTLIIALLFAKGVLIWRDVMLKQNQKWYEGAEKLRKLRFVGGQSEQLNCDHLWKSRFNQKRGSYVICSKCSEER